MEAIIAASPGADILDVGCGTGIEARQFQAAGCAVLGVEPDTRMAEFARRTGIEVEVATFEAWDSAGRRFDAVIAGTAWHWVDPVAGAVKLHDGGGRLEAVGNLIDKDFEIRDGHHVAARVSRKWFRIRDTYGVEVAPGQNDAFMIAVAVCLDRIHQEEEVRHG